MKQSLLVISALAFIVFMSACGRRPVGGARSENVSTKMNDTAYCYSLTSHKIDKALGFSVTAFHVPVSEFNYIQKAFELWIPSRLYHRLVASRKISPSTPIGLYYIRGIQVDNINQEVGLAYDYSFTQSFADLE